MSMMKGRRSDKQEMEPLADDEVTNEVWEALRDVLFNKYQRRRCPWKLIEDIDKRLGRESESREK